MNSLKVRNTVTLALLTLGAATTLVLSPSPALAQAATAESKTRATLRWEWSDDGWSRKVEVHGKVEFNEEYSDVSNLSADGYLELEEVHDGKTQRLEVRREGSGKLVRKYFVNGESRELDTAGRKWVADLLLLAVRQGAVDVENRVKRLVRQRGVHGALEEITSIQGDHAKRIYFQALLKAEGLSHSDRPRVLQAAAAKLSSDYEKANVLRNTVEVFLPDPALGNVFFRTVPTIHSDHERRRVLSALLKQKPLSEPVLSQMFDAAASITSDHEKATFLLEASRRYSGEKRLRNTFLKVVETLKSDHERGRVLSAMLKNGQIG